MSGTKVHIPELLIHGEIPFRFQRANIGVVQNISVRASG